MLQFPYLECNTKVEVGLYLKRFSYSLFDIVMYCYDRIYELNDLQLNESFFG